MKVTDEQIKRLGEKKHTKAVLSSFLKRQTSKDREKKTREKQRQKDRMNQNLRDKVHIAAVLQPPVYMGDKERYIKRDRQRKNERDR